MQRSQNGSEGVLSLMGLAVSEVVVCVHYVTIYYVCTKHSPMPKWVKLVFFLSQVHLCVSVVMSHCLILAGPWEHMLWIGTILHLHVHLHVHGLFAHSLQFWLQGMCKVSSGQLCGEGVVTYSVVCKPGCGSTSIIWTLIIRPHVPQLSERYALPWALHTCKRIC